jgi:hypothetical protein
VRREFFRSDINNIHNYYYYLKWCDQYRTIVNNLRYRIFTLKRLTYHLPRSALHNLLDGVVYSILWSDTVYHFSQRGDYVSDLHSGGPDSVQKQLNCALRYVLNVKLMDKVSIVKLHKETKSLTLNQLAIESMRQLVLAIMNNECRGLKDVFEVNVPQEKCLYQFMTTRGDYKRHGQFWWYMLEVNKSGEIKKTDCPEF